jgi:hypothetical protein
MNRARVLGVSFAAVWLLGGCVITTTPAPAYGMAVAAPPPQPVVEARTIPRDPSTVWVPGYWHWTGIQYTWIPGHWVVAPSGAVWRAPRYTVREGVYYYEPGEWVRR